MAGGDLEKNKIPKTKRELKAQAAPEVKIETPEPKTPEEHEVEISQAFKEKPVDL